MSGSHANHRRRNPWPLVSATARRTRYVGALLLVLAAATVLVVLLPAVTW